jgi:hypothetical protein
LTQPGEDAPAVCLLDTGVTQAHPLIAPGLAIEDATTIVTAWGSHDNGGGPNQAGHGTTMAGLALYGDLAPVLQSADPVVLRHRLESVKILPPTGANDPDLYGAITAQATSLPEIQAPLRRRVFSMAVTAPSADERGQPTSWSAAVDALAAGRSVDAATEGLVYLDQAEHDAHRLFVLAAGNSRGVHRQGCNRGSRLHRLDELVPREIPGMMIANQGCPSSQRLFMASCPDGPVHRTQ